MRHYELMVILDSGLEEDSIRATVDRATQLLTEGGAKVEKVDRWGKRRFAYEVHHRSEGYYVVIDAMAEPATVAEVDRMLGLADEVIRHKIVRLPDKAVVGASSAATDTPGSEGGAPAEANENGAN
jgi:small subunit ribosomal protein S6